MLLLCALVGGSNVWGQADYSAVYTSSIALSTTGGTSASTAKVKVVSGGTEYDAIKAGTGSATGAVKITVPAGTKYLHFHAAGWNKENISLAITPSGYSNNIALTSDSGISGNSPFTLSGTASSSNFYKVITFSTALSSNTDLTFTASGEKRFVIWGVNEEALPSSVTVKQGGSTVTNLAMTAGDEDVTLTATVTPASASQSVTWESDNTSVATVTSGGVVRAVGAGTANIKAISSLNTVFGTCAITVSAATNPAATVSETALDFSDVEVGQTKNLTFTVTPANLTEALTIASNNVKYTVSPTSIAQDVTTAQTITVTAAPTALNDDMDGTITISGGGLASNKTVTLSAAPYQVSNVTLVATDNLGTFKQGDDVVTSIISRVGNTVTLTAVSNSGYVFNGWTATGATPASSNTATTEFTLSGATVTLTANFTEIPVPVVTLDLSDNSEWKIPTSSKETGTHEYTSGDYTITLYGPSGNGYYFDTDNVMLGKTGASLSLPAFSFDVKKITVYGATGASGSVTFNIFVGDNAVSSEATSSKVAHEFEIATAKQTAGTIYTIKVTNANNMRISSIEVYGDAESVTVTSAKYATYCSKNKLDFSGTGITAYKAVSNGSSVELTQITDGIIPAKTGVILYSPNAVAKPIPFTSDAASTSFTDNELIGITARTKVAYDGEGSKKNYILANEASGIGFYKATSGEGAYLPANRAYLSTANVSPARYMGFDFDSETTKIAEVEVKDTKAQEVYDLQGRKVKNPTRGLYIVNGKKVVMK